MMEGSKVRLAKVTAALLKSKFKFEHGVWTLRANTED